MPWRACLISIFALGVWMALGATRPALCAADDSTGLAASEQAASSDLGAVSPSAGALGGDLSLPPDDLGLALRQPWTWPQLLQRIWLGWLVAIGAATGSFLNVVIYRAPRGQSLSFPPSRCPQCLHPIRPWHNVPVLGWLWLRGKCHDCGAAISARYPLVEALVAALFGALGLFEAFSAGKNLPASATLFASGPLASPDAPAVWYVVAYHAWLWCALVAAALIAWDRQRLPGVLFWPTLAVALAGPTFIAGLHPVATGLAGKLSGPGWLSRAISPAIGAAIAAGIALALSQLATPRAVDRRTRYAPLVWVGGFLGWQSASVLAAAASVAYLLTGFLTSLLAGGRAPWSAALAVATIAWTLAWGQIVEQAPRLLGEEAPWALAALGLGVSVALVWTADRLFTRGAHSAQ